VVEPAAPVVEPAAPVVEPVAPVVELAATPVDGAAPPPLVVDAAPDADAGLLTAGRAVVSADPPSLLQAAPATPNNATATATRAALVERPSRGRQIPSLYSFIAILPSCQWRVHRTTCRSNAAFRNDAIGSFSSSGFERSRQR